MSDLSGRYEYRQHHPCHSERQRRISWVEPPTEILRRLAAPQNDSERRIAQFRYKIVTDGYEEIGKILGSMIGSPEKFCYEGVVKK